MFVRSAGTEDEVAGDRSRRVDVADVLSELVMQEKKENNC